MRPTLREALHSACNHTAPLVALKRQAWRVSPWSQPGCPSLLLPPSQPWRSPQAWLQLLQRHHFQRRRRRQRRTPPCWPAPWQRRQAAGTWRAAACCPKGGQTPTVAARHPPRRGRARPRATVRPPQSAAARRCRGGCPGPQGCTRCAAAAPPCRQEGRGGGRGGRQVSASASEQQSQGSCEASCPQNHCPAS